MRPRRRPHLAAEERLGNDPTSELWGEHRSRYRFAARQAAGLRVLDIACGAGFGLEMLRQAGARAIGMDLDAEALSTCRRGYPCAPVSRADAAHLPLPDESMDLVVSFETLEHVPDAEAVVAELARVLRPGGRLVLSTPNRVFGPPERHAGNPYHVREFDAEELRALLRERFERVAIHGQWVSARFRFVPYLMVQPERSLAAFLWKLQNRLPFAVKERIARVLGGRSFYPGEEDYYFLAERWEGSHALLAVAASPHRSPARRPSLR